MKLFDKFEAVKFPEENLIFVTSGSAYGKNNYLYYVYDPKYKRWSKWRNAGNDSITVDNYQDISKGEFLKIMEGKFPKKETDFMRLCNPRQLCIRDMLDLLHEDYLGFMSDKLINTCVHQLLLDSGIYYKSYLNIREIFDKNVSENTDHVETVKHIRELYRKTTGKEIFRREIGIIDGHDSSSYFWIMPIKVIDYDDTDDPECVEEMRSCEISIEEMDVSDFLAPFLFKHFDDSLEANQRREVYNWTDDEGVEHISRKEGFEWYLTYNFFTFESVKKILDDIKDTVLVLSSGKENSYTDKIRKGMGWNLHEVIFTENLSEEESREYNANKPEMNESETDLVIDFYNRFIYRMEYMLKIGEENGYDLISFMGP